MEKNQKKALIAAASVPLIMTLGNSMLIPVLPSLQKELQVSSLQISLLITVYSIVAIVLIPLAGYLSDRFGRKKIMLPSLIIAGAGGLLCGTASWFAGDHTYLVILLGRLIQGIGAAGAAPIVIPLMGDMYEDEREVSGALGIIETSNTLGKVISPILGSLLALWAWYAVFLSIPVFCLASVLLAVFLIKVPKRDKADSSAQQRPGQFFSSLAGIARQEGRWLSAIFAIGAVAMFVLFGVLFYLSNVLEELFGIHGVWKGTLLAIPLSALCLSSFLTGKWIGENKARMKWVAVGGLGILALSLFGIARFGTDPLWLLFVCVGLGGIGIGASLPCMDALITEGIRKEQRGTVTSLYSSMRFIGVALGPPVISIGMDRFPGWLFYGLGALSLLALLYGLFAVKPERGNRRASKPDLPPGSEPA
ncbi:MFS transporter, ACDE family, multidrug resistance protein [Paenibacillus sp. UNCCL117]|uniref:MFS transporter n=1 Tax=unclassified Paenibacillus TaxID=185978 RepID=UPI0008825164|nr:MULTISPECIES: MFS transporter [unclassified Paenibacillus]SDC52652.1 MFS transporter, ACDE family, multidrug resistance protein [Paenibacillus sp. cl123]SFW11278.1 MFS transporter, ACDE family, multidrug resistance protein [Paenibacillus sp. UNCCL117]